MQKNGFEFNSVIAVIKNIENFKYVLTLNLLMQIFLSLMCLHSSRIILIKTECKNFSANGKFIYSQNRMLQVSCPIPPFAKWTWSNSCEKQTFVRFTWSCTKTKTARENKRENGWKEFLLSDKNVQTPWNTLFFSNSFRYERVFHSCIFTSLLFQCSRHLTSTSNW